MSDYTMNLLVPGKTRVLETWYDPAGSGAVISETEHILGDSEPHVLLQHWKKKLDGFGGFSYAKFYERKFQLTRKIAFIPHSKIDGRVKGDWVCGFTNVASPSFATSRVIPAFSLVPSFADSFRVDGAYDVSYHSVTPVSYTSCAIYEFSIQNQANNPGFARGAEFTADNVYATITLEKWELIFRDAVAPEDSDCNGIPDVDEEPPTDDDSNPALATLDAIECDSERGWLYVGNSKQIMTLYNTGAFNFHSDDYAGILTWEAFRIDQRAGVLFALGVNGTTHRLYSSSDFGATGTEIGTVTADSSKIECLSEQASLVWLYESGGGTVQRRLSNDRGTTFADAEDTELDESPLVGTLLDITCDPRLGNRLFMTISVAGEASLIQSDDMGKTWITIVA